jgi:SPP1 gp7 family putative phage head morphogenesis protein
VIEQYYSQVAATVTDTTAGVYHVTANHATSLLGVSSSGTPSVLPTAAVMETMAGNVLIQGAPQAAWWDKQAADTVFRFKAAVRQGLVSAETNQQIISRVVGELGVARNNAAALVQTSVQSVANAARMQVFKDNADVISGVQYLATLDTHTCMTCAPRDLMTWTLDGAAINATLPFIAPPLHFNCRCVLTPITRFSAMGKGQRASNTGPVSDKTTFNDYLDRMGLAFQDEVLGEGRAAMYRSGKITLQDLVSGNGRPLSLDELRKKYK